VQTSTINVGDIFYDPDLEQYVGIALDEHEVYAETRPECYRKLRGVNDVIVEHQEHNPMEPNWLELAEDAEGEPKRLQAEGSAIQ
jgi:hypothetical protein